MRTPYMLFFSLVTAFWFWYCSSLEGFSCDQDCHEMQCIQIRSSVSLCSLCRSKPHFKYIFQPIIWVDSRTWKLRYSHQYPYPQAIGLETLWSPCHQGPRRSLLQISASSVIGQCTSPCTIRSYAPFPMKDFSEASDSPRKATCLWFFL